MPKYITTSSSYFEPFTYNDLAAPVREMAEAHRATQDTYDKISLDAEALRRYIEQEPDDSNARRMYNSYMDKLSTLQNNLWQNGYNTQTRRDLSAARAGYASDISRLSTAIQSRQQRSAEYWKTKHEHPDMIMGEDPGLSGLDNYIADDRYGQNYYSYSGLDFENQVGRGAKARVNEMLSDPEVMRDPMAEGYLKRIQRSGFTSDEVAKASYAVDLALAGDMSGIANLDKASSILADVLWTNLQATGAQGNVSAEEFNRLVQFGKNGLAQAVGKTDVDYMRDLQWEENQKRSYARYVKGLEAFDVPSGGGVINDSWQRDFTGEQFEANQKAVQRFLGKTGPLGKEKEDYLTIASTGQEVWNDRDASSLVYGEGIREEGRSILGIDVGQDVDTNGMWPNTQKSFLKGQIVVDGVTYDTRYNSKTNNMEISPEGKNQYKTSKYLTDQYNLYRKRYEDNLEYRKKNDPEIYKRATINPDKQAKFYERQNIPAGTRLNDVEMASANTAEKSQVTKNFFTIAQDGADNGGYLEDFGRMLPRTFKFDSKGKVTANRDWMAYNNSGHGIHKLTKSGTVGEKAILNPADVFKFNDAGNIINLERISLDLDGLLNGYNDNGYILCEVAGDNNIYTIGIDMIDSNLIRSTYYSALNLIGEIIRNNPNMSREQLEPMFNYALKNGAAGFRGTMWNMNSQGKSGTTTKNPN